MALDDELRLYHTVEDALHAAEPTAPPLEAVTKGP
jgi:hypothetical protein